MREPEVVYIMQNRAEGTRKWITVFGPWSVAETKREAEERAKRFTENSVGWQYRYIPFKEAHGSSWNQNSTRFKQT